MIIGIAVLIINLVVMSEVRTRESDLERRVDNLEKRVSKSINEGEE